MPEKKKSRVGSPALDAIMFPKAATPALNALYYGAPEAEAKPYEPGPRELLAQKLQQQFERFMPAESAKKGARKITGYTYPFGLADITPVGIGLSSGEGIGKGIEAAGAGEYGRAALEGLMGAANVIPGEYLAAGAAKAFGPLAAKGLGAIGATAYHGTPHRFEKFDISKIGTGEGAQAYGHGLYFAESPGVAESYRDVLASPRNRVLDREGVYIEPSPIGDGTYRLATASELGRPQGTIGDATQGITDYQYPSLSAAIKDAKKLGLLSKESRPLLHAIGEDGKYVPIKKASDTNELLGYEPQYAQFIASNPGALYKVDIPDEAVARMLDWDKPLSEQPEIVSRMELIQDGRNVKAVVNDSKGGQMLWRLGQHDSIDEALKNITGRKLNALLRQSSVPTESARVLSEAGIPGIKYLDEGSRAAGEGTRNFVLFSDELPRILEVNEKPTGALPWAPGEWKPTQE